MTRVSISVAPRDNIATSEYFAGRCQGKVVLFSLVLSLLLITNVTYDDLKRGLNGEMDLLDFLRTARDDVKYLDAFKEVHVVLGNPSCDLDSTVSSIIHSCYLSKISSEESRTIIPVLNIPREDYPLRTEVTSFLSSQEINESYLIFRDDIDLRTLAAGGRLKLTLVDHNVLATEDAAQLDPCVVQIIDHHDNGRKDEEGDRDIDIQLEPVGSCTSLIVENILNKSEELLDERTATLALGTILLDTVNLSTEADRTTEKDKEMVDKLSRVCPNLVHQEVFDKLQQSKFDVTGLSAMDILRKDLKSVSDRDTTIGLSSIPCSIEVLFSKSDENEEERGQFLQEFCKSRSLSALLLVAAFHGEDGNLTRELGVFSPFDEEDQLRTKLTSYLSSDAAGLLLEEQGQHFKALSSFRQGNVKASRKVILPCVQRFLEERGMDAEDEEKGNNREADGASVSAAENEGSETKKSNEEVINEMPQAEADIQAETNPQVSGERENERGEAEGAEEDDDADKISIKIARKNPPTISPDVQVLVDEADGGRGRLDTLLSDTSIGEFDYTIDDDDDEDEEETGREAKGAYSGAADSPNRKRLSAELALHLEDGTSITTEIIDAAYPAVLTPTSTEMSWDDDASVNKKQSKPESIPQYSAREEHEDRWRWRKVKIGDTEHTVDNKVIEPYKKVLSHGGYYGDTMNAIIVIASCYLPEKSRKDYEYVMHNLFLYVVSSLELLVAQDYMIVYFHGAAPRTKVPSLGWMKRCYQMIDRRLKKNLKGLYIIHPTGWLKTVITFTRPFISAKFYRKLKFIYRLKDLEKHVSMEYIYVPEEVKRFDETKREKAVRPPSGWIDGKPEEIPSISNGFPSPPYNARPRRRRRNPYPEADQSFMPQDADDLSDLGTEGPDSGRSSRRMSFSGSLGFFEDDFLAYAESHQPCSIEEYLMQQRELFEQLRQEAEEEYDLENVFP